MAEPCWQRRVGKHAYGVVQHLAEDAKVTSLGFDAGDLQTRSDETCFDAVAGEIEVMWGAPIGESMGYLWDGHDHPPSRL